MITREETIKRLKEARNTIQPFRYVDEAIDYAIKALEQEPYEEYESDLKTIIDDISKEGNQLISKKDLLRRFKEVDEEYEGMPWNLLQILANINILIGQEPCEDVVSRQAVLKINENHHGKMPNHINFEIWNEIKALPSVNPTRAHGKWRQNGTGYDDEPIYECSQCGKKVTFGEDGSFKCCPYCFIEMR